MKKRYILLLILILCITGLAGYRRYFYQFKDLTHASLLGDPLASPDGKYNARAYYIPYGGAAGGVLHLVEIENVNTGHKKTIYSSEHQQVFSVAWTAPDVVQITNETPQYNEYRNAELNVNTDIYEESGAACRSFLLKDQFKTCYQNERN